MDEKKKKKKNEKKSEGIIANILISVLLQVREILTMTLQIQPVINVSMSSFFQWMLIALYPQNFNYKVLPLYGLYGSQSRAATLNTLGFAVRETFFF